MTRLVLVVMALASCGEIKPKPTPIPNDGSTCADVCQHGDALHCDWAKPTQHGATCLDVCFNANEGGPIRWDLTCRVHAPTCAAVRGCQ